MAKHPVYGIKKNTEILLVASKDIGIEVNADNNTFMVISQDQNAGRIHNIKTDNKSSERRTVQIFGNNLNESEFYS